MKNMPSVIKEMPSETPRSIPGKKIQKGRQPASVNGLDSISSAVVPISPVAFHRLFQDSLRVHDQAGISLALPIVDGQDQGSSAGQAQLTPSDGEKRQLPLAGTESRSGKGRLISAPGVKGKTGKKVSVEGSLNANPNVAVSSQSIPIVDINGGSAPRPAQETTESHLRLHSQADMRGRLQKAAGTTHDHPRSGLRHTGEYSVVRGEKGEPANVEIDGNAETERAGDAHDAARRIQRGETMHDQENRGPSDDSPLLSSFGEGSGKRARTAPGVKTSPLGNASAVTSVNTVPLSSGSENRSGVLAPGRQQHAPVKPHDHIRAGNRYVGEDSAFREEKSGSIRNAATVETDGNAKTGLTDETGAATSGAHSVDSETGNTRHANNSPPFSLLREGSGRHVQAAPGEKPPPASTATAVPAEEVALISAGSDDEKGILSAGLLHNVSEKMQNHIRSGRRNIGEHSTIPGEKGGPGKNATIVEMEGRAEAAHADDVDNVIRSVHGPESGRSEENKGKPDGSPLLSLFKENEGEHLRRAVVGEKTSLLSTVSAVPVIDAASISGGSDNGEGILSPGRQALLMAEVIDTARPLVQQGGGRVRISLSPPSLGALEIDVRVKKEGVELFVVANNADVQQTLCSHVDQLRKALVEQGLNMDRFQVVVGDRSDGQQGRDPRQEGMSSGHRDGWSEKGYLPGLAGDTVNDERGSSAFSGSYPSVGAINVFI